MALNDLQITELCQNANLVVPFQKELINPCSIDIRVGYEIKIERSYLNIDYLDSPEDFYYSKNEYWVKYYDPSTDPWLTFDLSNYSVKKPFRLKPQAFAILPTLETFNLPNNVYGELRLTSSAGRGGLDHAFAAHCDPGWNGSKLTMEIRNNFQHHSIPLFPGLIIAQMIFHYIDEPQISYAVKGRYNGDRSVAASKGFKWLLPPPVVYNVL
jgi:deoxycytidine triphosphate deaminase